MPEFTIQQLADLNIAVRESENKLKVLTKELSTVNSELDHNRSESIRLCNEAKEYAVMKEGLIRDNEKLRQEKDIINSKYEADMNQRMEQIRARKEELDGRESVLALRFAEATKREGDVSEKLALIDERSRLVRTMQDDLAQDRLRFNNEKNELEERISEVIKRESQLADKNNDIQ